MQRNKGLKNELQTRHASPNRPSTMRQSAPCSKRKPQVKKSMLQVSICVEFPSMEEVGGQDPKRSSFIEVYTRNQHGFQAQAQKCIMNAKTKQKTRRL